MTPKAIERAPEAPGTARVPEELLRSVVAYFDPVRVILFGSGARGEAGPDSDLDLLVVLDDDAPKEKLHWRAAWEARRGFHGAVDILRCRASTFEDKRDVIGSIVHAAATEGVTVYERRRCREAEARGRALV